MAEIKWPSEEDKYEAIGYLAVAGVVSSIEATVPRGQKDKFRKEYDGKYSDEYPYEADKYGKQFRIYLNDTEGCPDALRDNLDEKYGNRINSTEFITELVKEFGFKFTKQPQDSKRIKSLALARCSKSCADAFRKGNNGYRDFIQNIEKVVKNEKRLPTPTACEYVEQNISRKTEKKTMSKPSTAPAFSPNQILKLGWVGEQYIAYLLKIKDATLLEAIGIALDAEYKVEWFNEGVQAAKDNMTLLDPIDGSSVEYVKEWEDQSVGKGCDILVHFENEDDISIEVKSSKRTYPFFNMTSVEMQEMEKEGNRYVLIKLNKLENLIGGKSPEIIAIINPYEKLFKPKHIKEATFIIGGK